MARLEEKPFYCTRCEKDLKRYVWSDREMEPECPICGKSLEEIEPEEYPISIKIPTIGKFSSMTLSQKRASLKARATAHYKKEILPEIKDSKL